MARDAERAANAISQVLVALNRDARNFGIAARSENQLHEALLPVESSGYKILTDRKWPGGTRSQVDFVVVGPAGVFIVDAKDWGKVSIQNQRVYQDQDDVTDRFDNLRRLVEECRRDLTDIGLVPDEIHALAVFTNRNDLRARVNGVEIMSLSAAARYITKRHNRLDGAHVALVVDAIEVHFPPYDVPDASVTQTAPEPASGAADADDVALFSPDEVNDIVVQGMLREPIESWMSFLHPEQARLIRKSFSGPSRIRGAAGTGKTVVGLHRAAHLARTLRGKVLVTTYVKTLPAVLSSLMARMAPEIADRVEFMSVHAFAHQTLVRAGVRSLLDREEADQAWSHAWRVAGKASSLHRVDSNPTYWRDEVRSVIKGRALVSLEEYQACSRAGRTRRLTADQRAEVWHLFTAYQGELTRRDVWDFEDVVNNASALVAGVHGSSYSAVIVDEAQDLSCSMVRLLHALVGDAPDAFNLIGDGQQSIYPGGYTLSELGISIAGRGVVLSRNYRNTAEIASYASTIVAGAFFTDIEGQRESRDDAEFTRHGRRPQVIQFPSAGEHDARLIEHVRHLLADGQTTQGDIGVLALYRRQVDSLIAGLRRAGIATVNLDDYAGAHSDAVRVGTVKRAKGLEFKQVLVAQAPKLLLTSASPAADDVNDLIRRELYVAMTRARDGLWVGVA